MAEFLVVLIGQPAYTSGTIFSTPSGPLSFSGDPAIPGVSGSPDFPGPTVTTSATGIQLC